MPKVDVEQFIARLRIELGRFETDWAMGRLHDPKSYPARLETADWWEQLECWLEGCPMKKES